MRHHTRRLNDVILVTFFASCRHPFTSVGNVVCHDPLGRYQSYAIRRCSFENDRYGDDLPHIPTEITWLLENWPAFSNPGISWNGQDLAVRTTHNNTRVPLDGGPSFARMSTSTGKVTLTEYLQCCENEADKDAAPFYVFDPGILTCTFASKTSDTTDGVVSVSEEFPILPCFSNDAMSGINGSEYRPLPPAWLLVGVERSGTPIHDHPFEVAWNALLVGGKV